MAAKGQSAIEYLLTYGWMLLVVAIVGGGLFVLFQNQELEDEAVQGIENSDLQVERVNVLNKSLSTEIVSTSSENIESMTLCIYNQSINSCQYSSENIEVGQGKILNFANFSEAATSYEYQVNLSYETSQVSDVKQGSMTINAVYNDTGQATVNTQASNNEIDQTLLQTVEQFSTFN